MSNDPRPESLSTPFPEARGEPFVGALGRTRLENVHLSLPGGAAASVRVHTGINASTDPALAERLLRGELNWIQAAGSGELEQVAIPVIYHDETLRVFALVLPESYRAREIRERVRLLTRLDEDRSSPLPRYVVEFAVVYEAEGLTALLERRSQGGEADGEGNAAEEELAFREAEIVAREASLVDWENRLDARERRSSLQEEDTLLERQERVRALEELIAERKRELDGLEGLLRQQPLSEENVESPTRVADRAKMERAARAAELVEEEEEESLDFEGTSARPDAEEDAASVAPPRRRREDSEPTREESADQQASPTGRTRGGGFTDLAKPDGGARRSEAPTPLAQALLAATEAAESTPTPDGLSDDGSPAPEDGGDLEAAETAHQELPEPLQVWREQASPEPIWYVETGRIHLCVALAPQDAESFVGTEPVAVLQVHALPTYPLVTLGILADAQSLDELGAFTVFWPFDVAADSDREVLALLAEDFRLVLEVYDESLEAVIEQELHFPLEENARIAKERALHLWEEMSEQDRDSDVALAAFGRPDYPKLATEPLPLSTSDFQTLETAADVAAAARVVAAWSTPEREDVLLLQRSFPAAAWRAMRLRVLRAAIDLGVWLEGPLRRIALEAGFATSRRDLIRASLAGFEHATVEGKLGEMSALSVRENWDALLTEAERLGVVVEPRWEALSAEASEIVVAEESPLVEASDSPNGDLAIAEDDGAEEATRDEDDGVSEEGMGADAGAGGSRLTEPVERLDESDLLEAEDLVEEERPSALDVVDSPEAEGDAPALAEEAFEEVDAEDLILEEDAQISETDLAVPVTGEPTLGAAELTSQDLETLSLPELVVLLGDDHQKHGALLELVRRGDVRALPEMFEVLDDLPPTALVESLRALATLGAEAEPYFITALRSSVTAVRLGSATVLGALACERAEEGLVDLLLDEPTDGWTVVADALAMLGSGTVMALASRVVHSSDSQRARIARALASSAWRSDDRSALVGLSKSQDAQAASVATEALSLMAELALESDGSEADEGPRVSSGAGGTVVERLESRLAKVLLSEHDDAAEAPAEPGDEAP